MVYHAEPEGKIVGLSKIGYLIGRQEEVWDSIRKAFRLLHYAPVDTCYEVARFHVGGVRVVMCKLYRTRVPEFYIQGDEKVATRAILDLLNRRPTPLKAVEPRCVHRTPPRPAA